MPPPTATGTRPASTPASLTSTGTELLAVLLLPNWPLGLLPHAAKVPSEHTATVCNPPPAIAVTVLPASTPLRFTSTGIALSVVLLLPNWPASLRPQAANVPSEQMTRL